MCGIAGIFGAELPEAEAAALLRAMGDAMAHRGPDDRGEGTWPALGAGLTCRRLAFVDLPGGQQPIGNEDGSVQVVFNGEIYNHRALRRELEAAGHAFRTGCDTEAIVHLYEEHGLGCVDRLHGMFALAILDLRERRLVLARDGSGMKPLYWCRTQQGLLFASEVKALFASGLVAAEPDWAAIRGFLGGAYVPPPGSGFAGIHKLEPGARLVLPAGGEATTEHFWVPRFDAGGASGSDEDCARELERLLRDSVRAHMQADVPIGAYVSGGWDSSLVASYAAEHARGRLQTFSIVFPDDASADESRYSRRMAEHLGSDHHEVEFRSRDIPELLPKVVWHTEEPQTRSPSLLRFQLAKLASASVKGTVSGEGSDELLGGYAWFRSRDFTAGERLRRMLPRAVGRTLGHLPLGRRWDDLTRLLAAPDETAVALEWMRRLNRAELRVFAAEFEQMDWNPRVLLPHPDALGSCGDRLQRRMCLEFHGRLRDAVMLETDKLSMAHSLESRMPFLHRPVIDFALSLPSDQKRRGTQEKFILKRLVRNLPPEIRERRKQGLGYARGFLSHPDVARYTRELLLESPSPLPILADRREIEALLASHSLYNRGGLRPGLAIWSAATLQAWWNAFFAAPASAARPSPAPEPSARPARVHAAV
jgi:asparagine synthase (glutamine-hydrolysing)